MPPAPEVFPLQRNLLSTIWLRTPGHPMRRSSRTSDSLRCAAMPAYARGRGQTSVGSVGCRWRASVPHEAVWVNKGVPARAQVRGAVTQTKMRMPQRMRIVVAAELAVLLGCATSVEGPTPTAVGAAALRRGILLARASRPGPGAVQAGLRRVPFRE